ncbi:hypothetical protein JHD50_12870 [Sulfurimonas sp. MAG313]|nr:hypothetical protein [Sulfurimonas sp. MAG313]MDF1882180.1 hypothetical protein [Sulfurimonas sp. MAG313]
MVAGMFQQELMAYILFGIILNFVFSLLFGLYLSNIIGIQEMMQTKGEKEQSTITRLSILIPFAKMALTLYRVAILQIYFLNQGKSHKDFWVYLTSE